MTNVLEAICNIVDVSNTDLYNHSLSRNRANSMGEALETYLKDAFSNSFEFEYSEKINRYNKLFSWLGTQNNPPDIMIKGGDAIEVKKTQSYKSSLALNSSFPKDTLKSSNPMITSDCRKCENWKEKDIIYAVGHTSDKIIHSLWLVYGNLYAAKQETYERFKTKISEGIKTISDVSFSETNELGRVNRVDPLGITNLRIRGMWQIENPRKVFNYIHKQTDSRFELIALIPLKKFYSFPKVSQERIASLNEVSTKVEKVQDPNNPAHLIETMVIKFLVK